MLVEHAGRGRLYHQASSLIVVGLLSVCYWRSDHRIQPAAPRPRRRSFTCSFSSSTSSSPAWRSDHARHQVGEGAARLPAIRLASVEAPPGGSRHRLTVRNTRPFRTLHASQTRNLVSLLAVTLPASAEADDSGGHVRFQRGRRRFTGRQVGAYQVTAVVSRNRPRPTFGLAADRKTPPRRLTTSTKSDRHPRWSPARENPFESNRGRDRARVIDLTGGEARQLTTIATGASNGIWSPDGRPSVLPRPSTRSSPTSRSRRPTSSTRRSLRKRRRADRAKVFTRPFSDIGTNMWRTSGNTCSSCRRGQRAPNVTPGDRDAYPTSTTFSVGDGFTFS